MGAKGTYLQVYIEIILAVKNQNSFIQPEWEEELYKYITGIVQNREQKMLAINGIHDHIHFFIGMTPICVISDLVREIKKSTNTFINERNFTPEKFYWQGAYGAFSHSHSELDRVIKRIMNQKEFHKNILFKDEYISMLKEFEIEYQDEYLFDWIE